MSPAHPKQPSAHRRAWVHSGLGSGFRGLRLRVWGFRFGVWGLRLVLGVWGLRFRVWALRFRFWGLRFEIGVRGFGFKDVLGLIILVFMGV